MRGLERLHGAPVDVALLFEQRAERRLLALGARAQVGRRAVVLRAEARERVAVPDES